MMIAQWIVFTRNFLKASRIRDYGQRKKISYGNKKQARTRIIHKFSGLSAIALCGRQGWQINPWVTGIMSRVFLFAIRVEWY